MVALRSIPIENQEHWHQCRKRNVGASEVAALFGASPYISRFGLWHEKKAETIVKPDDNDNEYTFWGNRLEPVIAYGLAEKQKWNIQKVRRYIERTDIQGMGTSLDYEIFNHPDGMGCFEIKNLGFQAWRESWLKNEDGSIEAPLHIQLQLQHQLGTTGREWGAIGFLVAGNTGGVVVQRRHDPTIRTIELAIEKFWESIARNQPPEIEDLADIRTLSKLFDGQGTAVFPDKLLAELVEKWEQATLQRKAAELAEEEAKGDLISLLYSESAEIGIGGGWQVSYKEQFVAAHERKDSRFRVLRKKKLKGA